MSKFKRKHRRKSQVVTARIWDGISDPNPSPLQTVCGTNIGYLETEDGEMRVLEGDYIVTYEDGSKKPCDRKMFEKTFELIDDPNETKVL